MRRFWVLLALVPCLLMGQSSNPPHYHNNPQQFNFGAPVQVSPFVHSVNYTTITDTTQIQPTALIFNTETFGSTGDFTTVASNQTFSVAGNVGIISASAASTGYYVVTAGVGGTITQAPDWAIQATINQKGAAATTNLAEVGGCNSGGTSRLTAAIDLVNNKAEIDANGTVLGAVTYTWPAAPFQAMITIDGNGTGGTVAAVWVDSGSGWTEATNADITATFNPSVIANLANFGPCAYVATGAATTTSWQFSNLVSGNGGAASMNNGTVLHYMDGRAYSSGPTLYYEANMYLNGGSWGTVAVNTANNTGAITQKIWVNSAGTLTNYGGQVIWNPKTATFSLLYGNFNNSNPGASTILYAEIPQSTINFFNSGLIVIPFADFTQLTSLPTSSNGWDPDLVCYRASFNYSTGACSKYLISYLREPSGLAQMGTATANPTTNPAWTSTGTDTAGNGLHEGTSLVRTNSGTGVSGSQLNLLTTSAIGNLNSLFDTSMNYLGQIDAIANFASSVGHLRLAALGNTEFLLTNDGSCFGAGCGTQAGQLTIQSAPVNVASSLLQPTAGVNTTSASRASVTTSAATIASGCYVAAAHGTNASISSIPITSSPSATWTLVNSLHSGNDLIVVYTASLPAGSTTFTATPNVSSAFLGLLVSQAVGTSCTTDATAVSTPTIASGGTLVQSSGVSTTQSDLGVFCLYNFNSNNGINASINGVPMSRSGGDGFLSCFGKSIMGPSSGSVISVSTGNSGLGYEPTWTPLEFTNYAPVAQMPTMSPAPALYATTQSVTLSSNAGTTICYTTDGSTPTIALSGSCTHGTTYSTAISVAASETLKAVAGKLGMFASAVSSGSYFIDAAPWSVVFDSTIPTSASSLSTTQTVTAGTMYTMVCAMGVGGNCTLSSSPSVTWTSTQEAVSNTVIRVGWATFPTSGSVTFTANFSVSTNNFPSLSVLSCTECTTGETAFVNGSSSAVTTGTISGIFSNHRNINLFCNNINGVFSGLTATVNSVSMTALSTSRPCFWNATSSYLPTVSATASWTTAKPWAAVFTPFDY